MNVTKPQLLALMPPEQRRVSVDFAAATLCLIQMVAFAAILWQAPLSTAERIDFLIVDVVISVPAAAGAAYLIHRFLHE